MLSRTADHLFWMARYTERAENTARMLDVHLQTGLLPQPADHAEQGWRAILGISELQSAFDAKYDVLSQKDVIDFMVRDPGNPSSIASCLTQARENARAVRGALTTEAWEIQNATWLKMQSYLRTRELEQNPSDFFEWVKHRSHLSRGVTIGTMLVDEALHFIRLGTFLERSDNTARIIDVKFHEATQNQQKQQQQKQQQQKQQIQSQSQSQTQGGGAAQSQSQSVAAVESPVDFYYWAAVLRSVSGFEIYRRVYRDVITPERVAELLILRADMPRSLLGCMGHVVLNLKQVGNGGSSDTERFAGRLHADLEFNQIQNILDDGLHGFLTTFLERIFELGNRISRDFLVPRTE